MAGIGIGPPTTGTVNELRAKKPQPKKKKKYDKEKGGIQKQSAKSLTKYMIDNRYDYFYVHHNPGNCKLITIDHLGKPLRKKESLTVEALRQAAKGCEVFAVNLINFSDIERLQNHFDMVYCNEVPIGYGAKHQYHALFVSPTIRQKYKDRLEPELESKAEET